MKRIISICLLMFMLFALVGCEESQPQHTCSNVCTDCGLCLNAACTEAVCAEKCPGHHACANVCAECGLCLNAACDELVCVAKCGGHHVCGDVCLICNLCADSTCDEAVCAEKCQGHREEVYQFPTGDYITTAEEHIDTGNFVLDIGENIYVRGDLAELVEKIGAVMEKVSGLDFDGAGYARDRFPDGKVHIKASRENLYVGRDWYTGSPYSEVGRAYAAASRHANVSPGDLLCSDGYALIHELGHVLMYRQSEWSHCQLLNEGFAEYTTYLVSKDMEQNDPVMLMYVISVDQIMQNMRIDNYNALYAQPLEYWFENRFEYARNANYSIGFRFMTYLDAVYGDYSKWITEFEKTYNYREYRNEGNGEQSSVERQFEVLKAIYGDNVLDDFYPWLKEHEEQFKVNYENGSADLRGAESTNWYPDFDAIGVDAEILNLKYQDLYINIVPFRKYLTEYKGFASDDLKLVLSDAAMVYLYREDGSYTAVCTDEPIDLSGIAYIKLVGEGELRWLKIDGSFCKRWK